MKYNYLIVPENVSPISWYRSFFSFGFILGVSLENEDIGVKEFENLILRQPGLKN